ncbi:MAG: hypothetical protein ACJ79C_14350 [Myxococcales bacterium]
MIPIRMGGARRTPSGPAGQLLRGLGNEGFEGAVAQIAKLEEQFGLADLDQFTPR